MKKNMKGILALMLCLLTLVAFVGCKEKESKSNNEGDKAEKQNAVSVEFSITANGTKVTLGADAAPILSALGTPVAESSVGNCGGKAGAWTRYTYPGFYLLVLENGSSKTVDQIELRDDSILTPKGVGIGSPKDSVTAAYGNGYDKSQSSDSALVYKQGNKQLEFYLQNGVVSGVIFACK